MVIVVKVEQTILWRTDMSNPTDQRRIKEITPLGTNVDSSNKRSFIRGILAKLMMLTLLCLLGSLFLLRFYWQPIGTEQAPITKSFQVLPNTSSSQIAQALYQEGLIRNPTAFLIYLRYSGSDRSLKAGEYNLSDTMSIQEIVQELCQGVVNYTKVTIPEGYTLDQIESVLLEKGLIDQERFRKVIRESQFAFDFLQDSLPDENRLEGFLFPATYNITKGMTELEIIEMMLKCFERNVNPDIRQKAALQGLSVPDLVTLASIVEKEARLAEERPVIAGVLFNRLRINMPLQVDATIQYALGQHRDRIYYQDLEVESPYNTYRNLGLPPGPIASPGMSSIEAVLNPAVHDYYYYVAKPDGSHVFSRTLDEHNQAKRRLR